MISPDTKIFLAGHAGMLGHALDKALRQEGFKNIITASKAGVNLLNQKEVNDFIADTTPEIVICAAGRTGGIIANKTYPAQFYFENIAIQTNLFEAARIQEVRAFVFYGSSCVYPRVAEQPMKEESLLTGAVEETSEGYAAAKIAGILGCRAYNNQYKNTRFIALLPNSMYGPHDNFDFENSHVLSALVHKMHKAKTEKAPSLTLWGSGNPRREFIHSEDVADATLFALRNYDKLENHHYNIGSGEDVSIKELAEAIKRIVGYEGDIVWDKDKPDGTARKLLDSAKFRLLGWRPSIELETGLVQTYRWFLEEFVR